MNRATLVKCARSSGARFSKLFTGPLNELGDMRVYSPVRIDYTLCPQQT